MLLAIDVGNTNVTVGAFEGPKLLHLWRLATVAGKTADEYGSVLAGCLRHDLPKATVDAVAIGSVVPVLTPVFTAVSKRYFSCEPLVVDHKLALGIKFAVDKPSEVGADRILNALAAFRLYGAPAIVLDFGTATTFDCISEKGYYLGGAIVVGPRLAAEALAEKTAKLPQVEFARPRRAIGRNTVECIQAGLYYGYLGMLEKVLAMTLAEMGGRPKLLATGGFGEVFGPLLSRKFESVPDLTLQGLRLAYETAGRRKSVRKSRKAL